MCSEQVAEGLLVPSWLASRQMWLLTPIRLAVYSG